MPGHLSDSGGMEVMFSSRRRTKAHYRRNEGGGTRDYGPFTAVGAEGCAQNRNVLPFLSAVAAGVGVSGAKVNAIARRRRRWRERTHVVRVDVA